MSVYFRIIWEELVLSLWKLCTGKCNQRQEMSTSLLPPLTLTVGKAPVHVYRKGQKAPTTSQQAVLTLLKRRHERYLAAHKGLDAATRIHLTAADTDTLTIRSVDHGSTCIHTLSQQVCRNANLLNDLGCSALAEHVVHRAKVRLKRRRNERRVCALRNRATHDPAGPGSRQLVCVKSDLLAVANPLCRGKPKSAETFAVHVKQACKRRQQEIELKLPPLTCNGQREGSVNRSAVSVETSLTCYSSCPASQRGSARNAKGRSVFGCSQLMEEPSEHVRVQPGRQRVVYFSEKQSETPRSTGVPSAPPATPATGLLFSCKYVPSLHDVKSQRLLKARLEQITANLKEGSHLASQAAQQAQEKQQKEARARLRAQQRAEIYALNKVMTEYEEQKFQALISAKV